MEAKLPIDILELTAVWMALPPPAGTPSQGAVRQCHGCGSHQPLRGHQDSCSLEGSQPDHFMEGNSLSSDLCGSHPRTRILEGRLPQPTPPRSKRMGCSPRYLQSDISKMEDSRCRHPSFPIQQRTASVCCQDQCSLSASHGCHFSESV